MSPEIEPVRGLPEHLPPGERILWQGSPAWRTVAVRALHARKVVAYFTLLAAWGFAASILFDGATPRTALLSVASVVPLTLGALALLGLYAWLVGRTTIYTITNRRVVMSFGVALPMTVNVPFRIIASAGLRTDPDGAGDIPLALNGRDKLAYLALWPHARPWRVSRPEPMLRAVPEAAKVAGILSGALAAAAGQTAPAMVGQPAETAGAMPQPIAAAA